MENLELGVRLSEIVLKLENFLAGEEKFSIIIDDVTGNSFVENL